MSERKQQMRRLDPDLAEYSCGCISFYNPHAQQQQYAMCPVHKATSDLLAACEKIREAHDAMFAQALSNPIFDAWGNEIDCSLFNEAVNLASAAIRKAKR